MKSILALDQGTTSSRAIVFDANGEVIAAAQKELGQLFPRPGWVEQDPREIWSSQMSVLSEALARANLEARDVAAIGITNQRETTLVWDATSGEPLYNAIVWQDRRTADACDRLKKNGFEPLFSQCTGLVLDPYFSGTKLAWILDNIPGARARAQAGRILFGTVDSWLVWKLSGGAAHITDPSNASRTLLYNVHTGDWDDELLAILAIPRRMLPQVVPSSTAVAHTAAGVLAAAVPLAGIAGDQQAALFGQCCFKPGMVKNTYGTGCFMLLNTGGRAVASANRLLTTVAWDVAHKTEYALEGSIFVAGAVVQWLRDGLGLIRSAAEVESLAASVADNGGVYLVPAFTGLGSPHWDARARGIVVGLTRGVTAGHIARAALEGIAYQTADVLDAMRADSAIDLAELRVDGGASTNDLLMQFQADILGVPVVRAKITETTALGAAYLAGLGVGFWRNRDEIAALWQRETQFEPRMPADRRAALTAAWKKAVERAKGWESA